MGPFSRHFTTPRYDQRGFGRTEAPLGQPYAPHEELLALLDRPTPYFAATGRHPRGRYWRQPGTA
ncbi:hypothetical protein [Archangium sp.]|uniref:hypothetical protein n=1 Tax=Archangium sp. TaxID=1872627 RepID=UPI002D4B5066|nr:hypothetical protein [Archangium sp.]HYO56586.1 hypothetical protein [Archangium sp.]